MPMHDMGRFGQHGPDTNWVWTQRQAEAAAEMRLAAEEAARQRQITLTEALAPALASTVIAVPPVVVPAAPPAPVVVAAPVTGFFGNLLTTVLGGVAGVGSSIGSGFEQFNGRLGGFGREWHR
jgi:hypothetical protein